MDFPVTTWYASLLGLLLVVLSDLVTRQRRRAGVSLGQGGDAMLERSIRAQGNFVEYVPMGIILMILLEVEVSEAWLIHLLGVTLLAGRVLHAWGMYRPGGVINGRFWGTALTWLMILGTSMLNLWHNT